MDFVLSIIMLTIEFDCSNIQWHERNLQRGLMYGTTAAMEYLQGKRKGINLLLKTENMTETVLSYSDFRIRPSPGFTR